MTILYLLTAVGLFGLMTYFFILFGAEMIVWLVRTVITALQERGSGPRRLSLS